MKPDVARPNRPMLRVLLRVASATFALLCGIGAAQAQVASESQVKAAFLYNFTKFVQWPAEAFATSQAPLVVCVPARDVPGVALESIEGKQAQGRELRVRRVVRLDEARTCHVLFIPEALEAHSADWLRAVRLLPVLTVGESDGFAESGGVIGFVSREDRVQFEINPEAAARANLRVSSQLLRLATIVRDGRRARP
jgi:hypothetical protein